MKTIGIDARLYSQTGVGTYLRNFLHFLNAKTFTDLRFKLYLLNSEVDTVEFSNPAFEKIGVPYRWHSFSEQLGFYFQLQRDNLDLMHFTYFSYPVLYTRPFIATIHDLTPIQFKTGKASTRNSLWYAFKHAMFQYVLTSQARKSLKVITPTITVKNQLAEFLPDLDPKKIVPIYEGIDYELANITPNTALKDQFTKPYFLYVGNFYPHKNVDTLLEAFQQIPEPYTLVLSGPNDFFAERTRARITELKLTDRVLIYHNKGKSDLKYLYEHALVLVHPSLSEGFGLPLVEAMSLNVPIIASDIPVFRELLPGGTALFNPTSAPDIAKKLQEFIKAPKKPVYDGVITKYSFEKMTEQTLELYNLALQE